MHCPPSAPTPAPVTPPKVNAELDAELAELNAYNYTDKDPNVKNRGTGTWKNYDAMAANMGLILRDESSGFESHLYYNEKLNKYAYVVTGTNDWTEHFKTNIRQGAGVETEAYDLGIENARTLANSAIAGNVVLSGHSQGGGIASAASMVTGLKAVTFNAAAVNPATVERYEAKFTNNNITAYINQGELLSHSPELFGGKAAGRVMLITNGNLPRWEAPIFGEFGNQKLNGEERWDEEVRRHNDLLGMADRIRMGR